MIQQKNTGPFKHFDLIISPDHDDVKGDNAHEIFKWAKKNYGKSAVPKWNFYKILINKEGKIEDTFSSSTKPLSNCFSAV